MQKLSKLRKEGESVNVNKRLLKEDEFNGIESKNKKLKLTRKMLRFRKNSNS